MLLIYDRVLASHSMPTLTLITIAAFLAVTVGAVLEFIRSKLLVRCGVDIDHTLSGVVLHNVLKQHTLPGQNPDASLRDVNTLRNFFGGGTIFSLFDIPWMPIFLGIIFYLHPVLGAFATGGGLVLIILAVLNEWVSRKPQEAAATVAGAANRFMSQASGSAEVVRAMGMINGISNRWQEINSSVVKLQTQASRQSGLLQSITGGFRQFMQVGIYGVGAYLALHNQASAGCMITASIIMGRALSPIQNGIATWKGFLDARGAYNRLDLLFKNSVVWPPQNIPAPVGGLTVEDVDLVMADKQILQGINFALQPGESMGIVGPSGAGKTTLCRLILGVWPTTAGQVCLDGNNVFIWDQEKLGKYVGYLPQDVELFAGPISANIARFQEVDSDKVIDAAKTADVHQMILNMPMGYDTPIGPGGFVLSGGQRQRIALARAIYDNPRLLIMDEPNSNLDEIGEQALLGTWQKLKERGGTLVVVTHKATMLSQVDKILLLKDGRQVDFGDREEIGKKIFASAAAGRSKGQAAEKMPVTVAG
jgi:PrtD family type I secretion system ABC transporter